MTLTTYVFIDESGDLGKNSASYFTIAALVTEKPEQITRIIKRYRQRKLKKSIRQLPEIKANNSGDDTKKYVLNSLLAAECSLYCYVIEKENLSYSAFKDKEIFYNKICAELLCTLDKGEGKIIVAVDKKHTNKKLIQDFDRCILNYLGRIRDTKGVEIIHMNSRDSVPIQVVDFIAWAIQRKFIMGDDTFFKIIEEKIVNRGDMLFNQKKCSGPKLR